MLEGVKVMTTEEAIFDLAKQVDTETKELILDILHSRAYGELVSVSYNEVRGNNHIRYTVTLN